MSDSTDPFAEQPYVPPVAPAPPTAEPAAPQTAPTAETPAATTAETPAPPSTGGWPFVEPRAVVEPLATAAPDAEPTVVISPGPASTGLGQSSAPSQHSYQHTETLPPYTSQFRAESTPPKRRRSLAKAIAGVTGLVLLSGLSGLAGAAVFHESTTGNSVTTGTSGTSLDSASSRTLPAGSVEKVAAKVLPSTVMINVAGRSSQGQGTGVIISENGTIITNNHVIEAAVDGGTVTVAFSNGTHTSARVLGRDVATDVAVIQAENVSGLTPAELGTSRDLQVGQDVVAIGSPFGLEATVTQGIISALNRPVSPGDQQDSGTSTIFPAVQTDAAINPGNSGGPLVDLSGRVIGINSAISTGGGSAGSIGLGFAIPIDLVRSVSEQILAGETVEHARIGVNVLPARGEDQITAIGARIGSVADGSAADDAGLRADDIVTGVDGHPVATSDGLVATIRGYRPGDSVTLTILRDGETLEVDLTLGSDGGGAQQPE